jgi:hypothetical protein
MLSLCLAEMRMIKLARHAGVMLLANNYLSLQGVLEAERAEYLAKLNSMQYILDQEVKENQRREEVIWQQETAMRRLKATLSHRSWASDESISE